jgi:glycosyltransferase involved in cell wall biosynthesis
VVLILSTPPLLAWTSLLYKYYKTKSVFVAQDVYPELPIRMGYLKNRFVRTILSSFDKATLSRFSSVVVLGERMRDEIVKKGYPKERIEIIENWQAGPEIKPIEDGTNPFVAKHGLEGSFVVQYSGNMGVAHNLSTILEAAKLLKFNPQIKFVFIGDGKRRQEVESTVKAENLPNVLLFPYQPLERLPETLTSAHLHLVSLRPELEGLAAPSKLYGILAAGKPVLFIGDVDGEIGRIVRRGECGFTVQNGADLAERILKLRDNELLRAKMGGNARIIYEREFTRERALDKYELLIRRLYADKVTHSG